MQEMIAQMQKQMKASSWIPDKNGKQKMVHQNPSRDLAAVTLELEKRAKQTKKREPRLHESY